MYNGSRDHVYEKNQSTFKLAPTSISDNLYLNNSSDVQTA